MTKRSIEEVIDSDDERPVVKRSGVTMVIEVDDDDDSMSGAGAGAGAGAGDNEHATMLRIAANVGAYAPISVERVAGEDDVTFLIRLVRARAQLDRGLQQLGSEIELVSNQMTIRDRAFVSKDRQLEDEFAGIEGRQDLPDRERQDLLYNNVLHRHQEKLAHEARMRELGEARREAERICDAKRQELSRMDEVIQSLKVKSSVRRALMERYPDLGISEAWERFVRDHARFGGRKVKTSLVAFFGKYKSLHPNANPHSVVRKYVHALLTV
jgi:hypothetical protein